MSESANGPEDRPLDLALFGEAGRLTRAGLDRIADQHGLAVAGLAVNAALTGLRDFLIDRVGPEAAFNTLQRCADGTFETVVGIRRHLGQEPRPPPPLI